MGEPARAAGVGVFAVAAWLATAGLVGCSDDEEAGQPVGSVAEQLAPEVKVQEATVSVGSLPEGAEVIVDGDLAGNTPIVLDLAPGQHALEVRAAGYRTARRVMRLRAGDSEAWTVRLEPDRIGDGRGEGRLWLETRPPATVRLEGEVIGRTPLEGVTLPSGVVPLEFELPDGSRTVRSVYVPAGKENRAFVDLTRAQRP